MRRAHSLDRPLEQRSQALGDLLALLLLVKERAARAGAPRELAATARATGPVLLVVPASLIANWEAEIDRFAPSLRVLVAHPSAPDGVGASVIESGEKSVATGFGIRAPGMTI